jgi:hypothetical protein
MTSPMILHSKCGIREGLPRVACRRHALDCGGLTPLLINKESAVKPAHSKALRAAGNTFLNAMVIRASSGFIIFLCAMSCLVQQVFAQEAVPQKDLQTVVQNAAAFMRSRQGDDGSFGTVQPRLQTALAVLSLLSISQTPSAEDRARIEKAVAYLIQPHSASGDLGDDVFRTESHSAVLTALLCSVEHIGDLSLKKKASEAASRGLRYTQRLQDRSGSGPLRGGWKMEAFQGKDNDRRASAWALLSYETARQFGLGIEQTQIDRGVQFLLASFKETADNADQIGGFSVDAEGLAVDSISAMGGWALLRLAPNADKSAKNLEWLIRHAPAWAGPNYFYTNFFRIRVLRFADASKASFDRAFRQLYLQVRDHQLADGSVDCPPGEAQNAVAMGPVFSTAMAILILDIQSSPLVFDGDYRIRPLF